MTISNTSPTSLDDQTPMRPIERWLFTLILFGVMCVFYIIPAISNQLASPEDPEDAQSSSSINSETSDLKQLDSIAPPRTYKQVKKEAKLQGTEGYLAWSDSFVTCVICLEAMLDSDTVRRLSCIITLVLYRVHSHYIHEIDSVQIQEQ
ncbi:uncharacterized protein NECHADRAFT_89522 [Fusarium vanettenii 77-13-4]|uniref:RING-type domain-containing protein n=1 Tax=Fusarium vanettenii (strain ATCC MYA-4622 / CBS 123669 / FGSC 9596 / NRRL 45880 / 77-13-4) TaxID=660122 RepID=C7ZRG3_FUSV7|nr:uncharacterized protein NECHADRAFT_89522 [Fusarium vanettenii 77-13-4]EEU33394.1 predicted protein [Fusarium vanettenii 77-13-4]